MKTINIALAADNNYAQHVAVVMESILENTVETNKVRFFLLSDGITAEKVTAWDKVSEKANDADLAAIAFPDADSRFLFPIPKVQLKFQ